MLGGLGEGGRVHTFEEDVLCGLGPHFAGAVSKHLAVSSLGEGVIAEGSHGWRHGRTGRGVCEEGGGTGGRRDLIGDLDIVEKAA